MLKIYFKVWIIAIALFFVGHFVFLEYMKSSIQTSFNQNGYNYLSVKSASLPFDTLFRTESEGSLRATIDGREITLKFRISGNPIVSPTLVVNVATPMSRLRFVLG